MRKLFFGVAPFVVLITGIAFWSLQDQLPWASDEARWRNADGPILNEDGSTDFVLHYPIVNARHEVVAKDYWVLRFPENTAMDGVSETAIAFYVSMPDARPYLGADPESSDDTVRVTVLTDRQDLSLTRIENGGRDREFSRRMKRSFTIECVVDEEIKPGFYRVRAMTADERNTREKDYSLSRMPTTACNENSHKDGIYITDMFGNLWGGAVCDQTDEQMCYVFAISSKARRVGYELHKDNLWDIRELNSALGEFLEAATVAEFIEEM